MPVSKRRGPGRGEGSQRLGKRGSRSAIPALFTISEEEEGQRRRHGIRRKTKASYYQSDDGRASRPGSSASGQIYSPTLTSTPTPTRTVTSTSPNNQNTAIKTDSLLFNKTDERLRLARERREEREKQNAIKEAEWQAREERARQHYEKHLEERRRKLEEQRLKEEQRRAAVEEKRRQKQEDDKVRHEAVMRRTMERSQVTRPKTNRWSWGGTLPPNSPGTPTGFAESAFLYPLDLAGLEHVHGAFSLSRRYRMMSQYADRRSVSTVNLSKHHDPVITKRLSSSSATLLHSPDRGPRRLPLTPWESNVVNRLQQPTHSYLARSRSAMSLTGEQTAMPVCPRSVSCHPMGSMSFKALQARPLSHSRSHERSLSRETSSSTPARRRTTGTTQSPQKSRDSVRKSWSNLSVPLGPALTLPLKMRTSSPSKRNVKVTAPSPGRPPLKPTGRPPTPKMLKSPGAEDPGNFRPVRVMMPDAQHPSTATKTQETEDEQVLSPPQQLELKKSSTEQMSTSTSESISSPPTQKTSAGTTDPEEASRIMAENRRLAREQREKEEEERRQQEEQARLAKEEMARRKAEERARREEEAQRQAEERRLKEEEDRKMEEERQQKEREEADRAQKQREEEESRQKEEAERLRQEREKHFQKEEAERLERKKRLEEIMKRTRRSDTTEKKITPSKNGDSTAGAASPVPSEGAPSPTPHSNGNRSPPDPIMNASTSTPMQRENGELDEVMELPPHSRLTPPNKGEEEEDQQQQQGEVITFRENGLPKPLSGMDDISVQQGADVA
uniref:ensconsin isoform X3 n=1 Tax=Doryrhamphus excisus TaxID=161450 RepID=UPI0025ADA9BA|nr:ensconsin isoform X3 [Doryrhamphus excisus]